MFRTDEIPEHALESVASQVGELLSNETDRNFLNELAAPADSSVDTPEVTASNPAYMLGETFAVWMLSLDAVQSYPRLGEDLLSLAQWSGRWHHQIRIGEKAKAYARSIESAGEEINSVRQLFVSLLAQHIDDAISWTDEFAEGNPSYADTNPVIRLLVVPAYQVYAFWFVRDDSKESNVLLIDYPSNFKALEPKRLLSSREFLTALQAEKPLTGFIP